ncbi:MAG: hypothetical protein HYY40_05550 [Bacteroidetes bacterium]|nr:hypothetical protein [Bacteroidota bacterium]
MKHFLIILMLAGFSANLRAQNAKTTDDKAVVTTESAKKHVCTAACSNSKHLFACGEEGHKCGKTCKKSGKEHVCTSACSDGKHALACGEKGHVCGKECSAKK